MNIFNKPALSPQQLLIKLESQGMVFQDKNLALAYLQSVGAFLLKAYWYKLQDPDSKIFQPNLAFDSIVECYEFDRYLRARAFHAIERLEIAIRSTIANQLALNHGPHWYLKANIFKPVPKWSYEDLLKKIEDEVGRSSGRAYIQSYRRNYTQPSIPQSWAVAECVTFGFWSKTYEIIRDPNDKKSISKKFGVDVTEVFASWLHALTYFRNHIAHHEKLLDSVLSISPRSYKSKNIFINNNRCMYAVATIINYLSQATGLPSDWKHDLEDSFTRFPTVNIERLGFPKDWDKKPGW